MTRMPTLSASHNSTHVIQYGLPMPSAKTPAPSSAVTPAAVTPANANTSTE
jgi:hypothetical protein